jgi:hypothetical protein
MLKRVSRVTLALGAALLGSSPGFTAPTTFHLMQIEQVIGGVNGDVTLQAIQLRMRLAFQNEVSGARLRAWDATGSNPVIVMDMTTNVPNFNAGARVLISTAGFAGAFGPTPDFVMTTPIPPAYLPAGKLTFEDDLGTVFWSLAWGGAAYTGTNNGSIDNDADGNFSPPFPVALPSLTGQSCLFPGPANAPSTNNAADYITSAGDSTFTNNAGETGTVPVELMGFTVR